VKMYLEENPGFPIPSVKACIVWSRAKHYADLELQALILNIR